MEIATREGEEIDSERWREREGKGEEEREIEGVGGEEREREIWKEQHGKEGRQ